VLRIETVVHNTKELRCGRSLEKFPQIVVEAKGILERFMNALSCIDQCFIADRMLEQLPTPSQVGKTAVGGIDLNKARMRWVIEALTALPPSPGGFTASDLARQVRVLSKQSESENGPRRAAYDLKKLRGKTVVRRIGQTRRYESIPKGLRAMAALVVLRNKASPCWPLHRNYAPLAARRTPQLSIRITTRFAPPCAVCFRNWGWPHEHRQSFCRASPLSAYS
jgi:hypothetical protein